MIRIALALLLVLSLHALGQSGYVFVEPGTVLVDEQGKPLRDVIPGEVMKASGIGEGMVRVGSGVKNLPGGFAPASSLREATAEQYLEWRSNPAALSAQVVLSTERGRRNTVPSQTLEEWFAQESSAKPLPPVWAHAEAAPPLAKPVAGWFGLGQDTHISGVAALPDGSVIVAGTAGNLTYAGEIARWKDADVNQPGVFLLKIAPELNRIVKLVWVGADNLAEPVSLKVSADGQISFVTTRLREGIPGVAASTESPYLVVLDENLDGVKEAFVLDGVRRVPIASEFDPIRRPVILYGSGGRHGDSLLIRLFANGKVDRPWREWQEGATSAIKLDFSNPYLKDGPFALWSKSGETLPDFPTPIGPWGAAANAGQAVQWTNVKSGQNPIRGANLKAEAMVVDNEGCVVVAGTIPFNMGFPDFDPFLMRFSPEGKLLWTNCFLTGLLSEPDQKTQALAIDPSNGDIIVCYWQHGNNRETLLLDPDGWLNKFTGTNGNIKITWIGRVDAKSGRLKNSTYIYAQMPDQKNPRWPDLNSAGVEALAVDAEGRIYVCGGTTISFPTTSNAFLPHVSEYGGHPMFAVLKPDLSGPVYSTYLSAGKGGAGHLALVRGGGALVFGTHEVEGVALPVTNADAMPFLSGTPPQGQKSGVFVSFLPVASEEASWSFAN